MELSDAFNGFLEILEREDGFAECLFVEGDRVGDIDGKGAEAKVLFASSGMERDRFDKGGVADCRVTDLHLFRAGLTTEDAATSSMFVPINFLLFVFTIFLVAVEISPRFFIFSCSIAVIFCLVDEC